MESLLKIRTEGSRTILAIYLEGFVTGGKKILPGNRYLKISNYLTSMDFPEY